MQSQRPEQTLEPTKPTNSSAMSPLLFLQPLHFETVEDVYKLLIYLKIMNLIKIEKDVMGVTKVVVPDMPKLRQEFIVDVNGETYLAGLFKGLMNTESIFTVNLNIKNDDNGQPYLDGEIVKIPTRASIFDMDIELLTTNGVPVPIQNLGEEKHLQVYNEVLAEMIQYLNPKPYGLLNVIPPMDKNNNKIIIPTNFTNAHVIEHNDNLDGLVNTAAMELTLLGFRHKQAMRTESGLIGNRTKQPGLQEHLTRLRSVLENRIRALEHNVQVEEDKIQELLPSYRVMVAKHPQYGDQRDLRDVIIKFNTVIQGRHSHYVPLGDKIGMTICSLGLLTPIMIYGAARYHHYDKRVIPYGIIKDYREAQARRAQYQIELDKDKPALERGLALIDSISAQHLTVETTVYQGVPVVNNQAFFQAANATETQIQVPTKEFRN